MSEPSWKSLLRRALEAIDSLKATPLPPPYWSFGGGTVLMLHYGHRLSKDIDIFVRDVQYITAFSPRLNDITEAIASAGYDEQSNYIRLYRPEGEIDIVVAPALSSAPTEVWQFDGREIQRETPLEILAKKAFYRGAALQPRDLFDLIAFQHHSPRGLSTLRRLIGADKAESLRQRVALLLPSYAERATDLIDMLPAGERFAQREAAEELQSALERRGGPD